MWGDRQLARRGQDRGSGSSAGTGHGRRAECGGDVDECDVAGGIGEGVQRGVYPDVENR